MHIMTGRSLELMRTAQRALGPNFDGSPEQRRVYRELLVGEVSTVEAILDKVPPKSMLPSPTDASNDQDHRLMMSVVGLVPQKRPRHYPKTFDPRLTLLEVPHRQAEQQADIKQLTIYTDPQRLAYQSLVFIKDQGEWAQFFFEPEPPYITAQHSSQWPVGAMRPSGAVLERVYRLTDSLADARILHLPVATDAPHSVQ